MAKTALVVGGTGVIGRAVIRRLLECGWQVTVASRGTRPLPVARVRFVPLDVRRPGELAAALGGGADVLVHLPVYEVSDAERVLSVQDRVSSIIVVSSAAVYVDARGRGHDESVGASGYPQLPVPVKEDHPTARLAGSGYPAHKMAIERTLFDGARVPITVFRPCRVHGIGAERPMEWYFLKRALDRRPYIIHGRRGRTILHPVSARNLAELIRLAAERPCHGVFNAGDDDPLDALHIGRIAAATAGYRPDEILLPDTAPAAHVGLGPEPGASPWNMPHSIVLDMSKARAELGYAPIAGCEQAIAEVSSWLRQITAARDWRRLFPRMAQAGDIFDYPAEDARLPALRVGRDIRFYEPSRKP